LSTFVLFLLSVTIRRYCAAIGIIYSANVLYQDLRSNAFHRPSLITPHVVVSLAAGISELMQMLVGIRQGRSPGFTRRIQHQLQATGTAQAPAHCSSSRSCRHHLAAPLSPFFKRRKEDDPLFLRHCRILEHYCDSYTEIKSAGG
jgi:hypothetical protein